MKATVRILWVVNEGAVWQGHYWPFIQYHLCYD